MAYYFIADFDVYCSENGIYEQTTSEEQMLEALKEEDLQLVCYMILKP